ncbi:transposase [Streptomyces sp. NPDC002133]
MRVGCGQRTLRRSKSNRSRRYTEEFKRDAVALVRSSGKTVTEVAR